MNNGSQKATASDRRTKPRYMVRCRVVAIAAGNRGALVEPVLVPARIVDLSRHGARLIAGMALNASRLWLRFAEGGGEKELVECRVVRTIPADPAAQIDEHEYGLSFRSPLTSSQLKHFIDVAVEIPA